MVPGNQSDNNNKSIYKAQNLVRRDYSMHIRARTHSHTHTHTHTYAHLSILTIQKLNLRNLKMGSNHCKCNWSDTWPSIPLQVIFVTYQTPLLELQICLSLSRVKLHY